MLMRERVAIVLITLSVMATLVLGGAAAYELGRSNAGAVSVAQAVPGTGGASSSPAAGAGAQDNAALPAAGQPSAALPGAGAASTGGGGVGGSAVTGPAPGAAAARGGTGPLAGRPASAPAGVANGVITVGGIYDETGPVDATVQRDTVRSYFDEVNAAGGVNGYHLRLIDCDSAFDPTRGHQCSERLAGQGVLAVVGWLSPSSEQSETSWLASQGIPMIGGLGVPAEFQSPLSYPVSSNLLGSATDGVSAHAVELNIHAPALVIINTPISAPAGQRVADSLHRHGIHEKSIDFADATKPDYTDLAVKIRLEGADSIIAALDPFSYARFFQALDRQNFHPPFLGFGLDKKSAERQYGPAVYGAESLTPFIEPDEHLSLPAIAEYYGAVQRYYPAQVEALDVYSEGGWVAAKLFVEALRRLGSTAPTPRTLVDSLDHISRWDSGLTVPLSFSPGPHDPNRCLQWIRNQQGTWHTYSGWNCF